MSKCHAMQEDALPHAAAARPKHMVESGKVAPCRAHVLLRFRRRLKLCQLTVGWPPVLRLATSWQTFCEVRQWIFLNGANGRRRFIDLTLPPLRHNCWSFVSPSDHLALPEHGRISLRDLPEAFRRRSDESPWIARLAELVCSHSKRSARPSGARCHGDRQMSGSDDTSPFQPPRFRVPASSTARMKQEIVLPISTASCGERSQAWW